MGRLDVNHDILPTYLPLLRKKVVRDTDLVAGQPLHSGLGDGVEELH